MELVKTIQIDDEIYLPLPVQFGIQEGQEFYIYKSNDGTLVLCHSDRKLSENALSDFIDKTLYEVLKAEINIGHKEIRQGNVQSSHLKKSKLLLRLLEVIHNNSGISVGNRGAFFVLKRRNYGTTRFTGT